MKRFAVLLLVLAACNRTPETPAKVSAAAGNAERGKALITQYGCNVCHIVPGTDGPQGSLGPSLQGVASRPTISYGAVQNTPANLAKYIADPPSMNPQTTMPSLGLAGTDAHDITAYLLTLK